MRDGRSFYAGQEGNGKHTFDFAPKIEWAHRWYGKHGRKYAADRVRADYNYMLIPPVKSEIIELDEEPHWYFEITEAIYEIRKSKMLLKSFIRTLPTYGDESQKTPMSVKELWDYAPDHQDEECYYLMLYYNFLKERESRRNKKS